MELDFENDLQIDMDEWNAETWKERSINFKWWMRFLFKAIPWGMFVTVFEAVNILMNMFGMRFWGNGNVILIFNTFVSLIQGFLSFLLVAELPTYMKHLRAVRAWSFDLACIYNLVYFWGLGEFYYGH